MSYLPRLRVYGFDRYELVILAALVTEDPLLLIGRSGTGKTFLLNSVSEALGLEHRHYNASLISFDDLVGFPYPDEARGGVKFLETPATVWGVDSVLVDEVSRCKPEHQNRLFSLIHERRVQGIALGRLRFRWAAMNPCTADQDQDIESYAGSEPLDPALADRFALIVPAADWPELSRDDQRRIADPCGEGCRADDGGALREQLARWRESFLTAIDSCPPEVIDYATAAVTTFNANGVRVSPRRARFLTRSLLAAEIVSGHRDESLYASVLACTLPQQAWGVTVDPSVVTLTHRVAWDASMTTEQRKWIERFHLEHNLSEKVRLLMEQCPDPDTATQAICEFLARGPRDRVTAFAFALYPWATGFPAIGREALNDIGRIAQPVLSLNGELRWQERAAEERSTHPAMARFARVLGKLNGARHARAKQFLTYCAINAIEVPDPDAVEEELQQCIKLIASHP